MSTVARPGLLVISIDLELDAQHSSTRDQQALDRAAARLVEMLTRHRLPATWAVADPAESAATEILTAAQGHEMAVLGEAAWVGASAGRARFGRELDRRLRHARAAGLEVSTLALRKVHLDAHLDLVVDNGVTAIRGPESEARGCHEFNQPQSLYAGLWQLWPSVVLPGDMRWWPAGGRLGAARRGIRSAARRGDTYQLLVDGLKLAQAGRIGRWGLDALFAEAAALRETGTLAISTVAQATAQLSQQRRSRASQWRPAA